MEDEETKQQFTIRMKELDGKIRLAEMRSNRVSSFLKQIESPQERSQIDEVTRDIQYASEVFGDGIWVEALSDAGASPKVILKVWDLMEEARRRLKEEAPQPRE